MARTVNLLYRRYRLIALSVNIAVLMSGFIDWLFTGLGPRSLIEAPENIRFFVFVLAVISLIALEARGIGEVSFSISKQIQIMPFLARLALVISACVVTDLFYSEVLFLPILLYAYFAINEKLSYALAIAEITILLGLKMFNVGGLGSPPPPPPPVDVNLRDAVPPPASRPNRAGRPIDESMGSLITLFFTLLLARAISQATHAQQKLAELLATLETSHAKLQHYACRVADLAATEERNRLARDIHDSLGHHLAAINIQLTKAHAYRERDPDRAYEAVTLAQRTVREALKDVRESVSSLRRDSEPFLFQDALNDLLQRMRHSELAIALTQTGESDRYGKLKLICLYRAIQEGLTNVHKHARADHVTILLNFGVREATVAVIDDGCGFDVATWTSHKGDRATHGLIGLQERLSLLGGTLDIKSQPHETKLTAKIPLFYDRVLTEASPDFVS